MSNLRILTVSDLGVATGFSRVMSSVIKYFPEDWDIHSLAINYHGDPHSIENASLYPAVIGGDVFGFGRFPTLVKKLHPDRIFILQDAWNIINYIKQLPKEYYDKTVLYVPVDAGPFQSTWLEGYEKLRKVCAYTQFGKKVLEEANPDLTCDIVPHGIDTETFFPIDIQEAREKLGTKKDFDFIVINTNRNQPRKRLDIAAKAFGIFAEGKSDVAYHHHAGLEDAGWKIDVLADRYGWADKLLLTSRKLSPKNYVPDHIFNYLYNTANIGLNTSMGEGWGLCFVPDTKITTTTGTKNIQDIRIGDYVYDDTGNITKVTNLFSREISEDIYELNLSGLCDAISVTREHPFLTKSGYKKAEDLEVGDLVFKPLLTSHVEKEVKLSDYGHFVHHKDNLLIKTYRFGYKTNSPELMHAKRMFNTYFLSKKTVRKIMDRMSIDRDLLIILLEFLSMTRDRSENFLRNVSKTLYKALQRKLSYNGGHFNTINIPRNIFDALDRMAYDEELYLRLDPHLAEMLLDAYIQRNGYFKDDNRIFLSVSRRNKRHILEILMNKAGIPYTEFKYKNKKYLSINHYAYNNLKGRKVLKEDVNGFWYRVLGIDTKNYSGEVYNFETESHSYLVEGYAVHNCNVEHSITGHAQIIPAHSANNELYADGRGLLVPVDHYKPAKQILTEGGVVRPEDVAEKLEYAYTHREETKEIGKRAREYFLQDKFKWENISETFQEYLK